MHSPEMIAGAITLVLFIPLFFNIQAVQRQAAHVLRMYDQFIPISGMGLTTKGGSHA